MSLDRVTTLSRKWTTRVNLGTVAVPNWATVYGIQELKHTPFAGNLEDDNAYEDAGYTSMTKTALSNRLELKLLRKQAAGDVTTYDPGQEKIRTAAAAFGEAGVVHLQVFDRNGGPEAYEAFYEVNWENDGGDMKALETISVTLEGKGAASIITNPLAVAPPVPSVDVVSPTGGTTAGGTLVTITGRFFNSSVAGAAAVKFGANNATSYVRVNDQLIIAVAPAGLAGTVQVKVTNTTGASLDTAADNYTYA